MGRERGDGKRRRRGRGNSALLFFYFQDQSSVRDSPTLESVTTLFLKIHIRVMR